MFLVVIIHISSYKYSLSNFSTDRLVRDFAHGEKDALIRSAKLVPWTNEAIEWKDTTPNKVVTDKGYQVNALWF